MGVYVVRNSILYIFLYHDVKQNAKICAIGETECEVFIVGGQRIDQKRKKEWWRGSRVEREETKRN